MHYNAVFVKPGFPKKGHKCSKQAHFSKYCRFKSRVNMVNEVELAETSSSDSEVFIGKVSYMDFADIS